MKQRQDNSGFVLKAGMWACGLLAAVCLGFGVYEWVVGRQAVKDFHNIADLGNYGSFLQGAVASPWALAGVFLLVMAFLGSQQQLGLQREQLAAQEKQLNDQLNTMRRQRFEESFFQMFNLQQQVVAALTYDGTKPASGRNVFGSLYGIFHLNFPRFLVAKFNLPRDTFGGPTRPIEGHRDIATVLEYYQQFYHWHEAELGHYFRTLYHLIKFVERNELDDERRYTSLIRAQLSKYELFLLFYNCLSPYGKKFRPYVEEFGLLAHLDKSLLLDPSHEQRYLKGAYE